MHNIENFVDRALRRDRLKLQASGFSRRNLNVMTLRDLKFGRR